LDSKYRLIEKKIVPLKDSTISLKDTERSQATNAMEAFNLIQLEKHAAHTLGLVPSSALRPLPSLL